MRALDPPKRSNTKAKGIQEPKAKGPIYRWVPKAKTWPCVCQCA